MLLSEFAVDAAVLAVFAAGFHIFRIQDDNRRVFVTARDTMRLLSDKALSDDDKGSIARTAALRMIAATGSLLARTAAALVVPSLMVVTAIWFGGVSANGVLDAFVSWPMIVLAVLVTVAVALVPHR